jgi:hypothetical protein
VSGDSQDDQISSNRASNMDLDTILKSENSDVTSYRSGTKSSFSDPNIEILSNTASYDGNQNEEDKL